MNFIQTNIPFLFCGKYDKLTLIASENFENKIVHIFNP